eukprot:14469265-Ditylum_brightwellii.AAC.1
MQLVPASAVVQESQNIIECRAPTVPEEGAEAGLIPTRYISTRLFNTVILKENLMLLEKYEIGV